LPKLKEEAQQAQNQLLQLAGQEQTLHNKRDVSQENTAQIRTLESDKNRLEKEIVEIDEKLNLLLAQPDNAKCPVCQTELGASGLQHISKHYNSENKASRSNYTASLR